MKANQFATKGNIFNATSIGWASQLLRCHCELAAKIYKRRNDPGHQSKTCFSTKYDWLQHNVCHSGFSWKATTIKLHKKTKHQDVQGRRRIAAAGPVCLQHKHDSDVVQLYLHGLHKTKQFFSNSHRYKGKCHHKSLYPAQAVCGLHMHVRVSLVTNLV